MAKTRIKFDPSGASKRLKDKLNTVIREPEVESEIGIMLTERVRLEARRGSPLNDGRSFPELKDSSKRIRKGLAKINKPHQAFSPERSNLTFTGQLQDAISFKRLKNGLFELFVSEKKRSATKGFDGKRGESLTNKEVDKDLRSRGFELFTGKGLKSEKKIPRLIKQILLRFLRRQLRRS